MPVKIKENADDTYQVSTPGGVKSKGTTLRKAMGQMRLLNAIEHGYDADRKKKKQPDYMVGVRG